MKEEGGADEGKVKESRDETEEEAEVEEGEESSASSSASKLEQQPPSQLSELCSEVEQEQQVSPPAPWKQGAVE